MQSGIVQLDDSLLHPDMQVYLNPPDLSTHSYSIFRSSAYKNNEFSEAYRPENSLFQHQVVSALFQYPFLPPFLPTNAGNRGEGRRILFLKNTF